MNDSTPRNYVELQVSDFGPIARAEVELRPLTVFVGPGNAGKSCLSTLIYALHRFFDGKLGPFAGPESSEPTGRPDERLLEESINALDETALRHSGSGKPSDEESILLPPPAAELVRSAVDRSGDAVDREISRCFGVDSAAALIRRGRKKKARVSLRSVSGHELAFNIRSKAGLEVNISEKRPVRVDIADAGRMESCLRRINDCKDASERKRLGFDLAETLCRLALPGIVAPLHLPAYYLPSTRIGIMRTCGALAGGFAGSAGATAKTPMLSGVLADFLEQLIEISGSGGRCQGRGHDFESDIEKEILDGSVRVEEPPPDGCLRFSYRPDGRKESLPLMNASSMISELAPVVLYLRHVVSRGNLLIIEEPESHLHPAMQVELVRQFAALVRSGIRIIVTTHSEWMLEELSNVVRRFQIPETERAGTANGGAGLSCEQVGVWMFDPNRGEGSVVREICLDDDSGLYPSDFYDVAVALHNDWADISGRIEEVG